MRKIDAKDNSRVTTIDFLRHGECEGGNIYRGSTDVVLSRCGYRQMERVTDAAYGDAK